MKVFRKTIGVQPFPPRPPTQGQINSPGLEGGGGRVLDEQQILPPAPRPSLQYNAAPIESN